MLERDLVSDNIHGLGKVHSGAIGEAKEMKDGWPHSLPPILKDFPENSVAVVVCLRDNLKFFKLAFHSIISFTSHPYLFIVVDNMSSFTTKNYLKRLQKNHAIHVIPFSQEFNFAAQLNFGFNYAFTFPQIKYGVAIHSDTVVEPNWLNKLLVRFTVDAGLGVVLPEKGHHFTMFRQKTFTDLRGFDDKFRGHTYVIQDFCRRAENANWKLLLDDNTNIHHFFQTQMREGLVTTNHLEEDRRIFCSKYPELVEAKLAPPSLEPQGERV